MEYRKRGGSIGVIVYTAIDHGPAGGQNKSTCRTRVVLVILRIGSKRCDSASYNLRR